MGATLLVLFIKRKDAAESWRVGGCSCNYWTAGLCIKGQSEGKCVSVDLGNAFGVCVCCWGRGRGGDVAHNPRNILKIARLWQIGSSGGSRWLWGDLWELAFFIRGGRDGQSRCKRELVRNMLKLFITTNSHRFSDNKTQRVFWAKWARQHT